VKRRLGVALALVFVGLSPAVARAGEPVNVPWESLLPPLGKNVGALPRGLPECRHLRVACVERAARRFGRLADRYGCDHRAVFARNYQLLTQVLVRYLRTPGFFDDPRYIEFEAVLFERAYLAAMRIWDQDPMREPGAWSVALQAWRQGDTYGLQDLLLGINAHVQRDMPFVVAAAGVGARRKPDHDRMNLVLDAAYESIVRMVGDDFDPSTTVLAPSFLPTDDYMGLELVKGWREGVWRNAERLLDAKTEAERQQVTAQIEQNAEAQARIMAIATPGWGAQRDAYCRSKLQPAK